MDKRRPIMGPSSRTKIAVLKWSQWTVNIQDGWVRGFRVLLNIVSRKFENLEHLTTAKSSDWKKEFLLRIYLAWAYVCCSSCQAVQFFTVEVCEKETRKRILQHIKKYQTWRSYLNSTTRMCWHCETIRMHTYLSQTPILPTRLQMVFQKNALLE